MPQKKFCVIRPFQNRRPSAFTRERVDAAVGARAAKIAQEKMVAVSLWETRARIMRQSGRTVRDMRDRRHNVRRLFGKLQVPEVFGIPHARRRGVTELIGDAPAAVAAFHHIDQPRGIAVVAIVVAGEQIAVIIKRQFLRIAQTVGEHFQIRAVQIAAQHGAHVGIIQHLAFLRLHVESAVARC